jgi:RHS repeat-associated protein
VALSGSDQDSNQFAGQEYDAESSSQHATFRQYSSTLGRWMSPDAYDGSYNINDPQSLNRYTYASNSPLSYIDPDGTLSYIDADGTSDEDPCHGDSSGCKPPAPSPPPPGLPAPPSGPVGGPGDRRDPPGQNGGSAPSNGTPKSQAACIANALMANVPGIQSVTPTPNGPSFLKGGHENDTFNLSFSSGAAQAQFFATTSRTSLIPNNVSDYGYGPGQRLSGGLHAEFYGFPNGLVGVTSHLDRFNPNDGLGPLLGHLFVDLIGGHIGHPRLDKGC